MGLAYVFSQILGFGFLFILVIILLWMIFSIYFTYKFHKEVISSLTEIKLLLRRANIDANGSNLAKELMKRESSDVNSETE
ncbi:MerR family transcriptional regulator [Mobiluncus mulieris]|uniref:MerR family transcriptional regulator n=2 Tax=Mobiluncus mulieris TaxID=2052 RepID=A0ABD4TW19_9ACTO|nr:MerR family transcriptional regulator [Mobiluncus mulieris]MCU9972376.1 MerR family transcriptional regulator [Mobiluncus mulieris]MCV0008466.1 MerR family transcriptional regulator [Mobiluncus mulieris]NMW74477.1 MerR family transcriptional regulator [Mobiluncus mulieris]NMX01842.1 MerR family transcriptional regulator [Mobiluncus mulieris]